MSDEALTLEQHAERVAKHSWYAQEGAAGVYLAAYHAERAARLAAEARVRELEALWDALNAERSLWYAAADQARAEAATLRAQLATLREAAEVVLSTLPNAATDAAVWTPDGERRARLRAALAEPGPTLASIEAAAQARVLREMAECAASDLSYADNGESAAYWLHARADELEGKR